MLTIVYYILIISLTNISCILCYIAVGTSGNRSTNSQEACFRKLKLVKPGKYVLKMKSDPRESQNDCMQFC